jgi:hypothetical protein
MAGRDSYVFWSFIQSVGFILTGKFLIASLTIEHGYRFQSGIGDSFNSQFAKAGYNFAQSSQMFSCRSR